MKKGRARHVPVTARLRRLTAVGIALGSIVGVPSAFQMLFAEPSHLAPVSHLFAPPLPRGSDGLFHTRIALEGHALDCLIDTGATSLTLPARDIRRYHIPVSDRDEAGHIATAGGTVAADRVRIDGVGFAGRTFSDVPTVLVHGSTPCLIGQDLLARLDAVELRGGQLHLR